MTVLLFFLVGGVLLATVDERAGIAAAGAEDLDGDGRGNACDEGS